MLNFELKYFCPKMFVHGWDACLRKNETFDKYIFTHKNISSTKYSILYFRHQYKMKEFTSTSATSIILTSIIQAPGLPKCLAFPCIRYVNKEPWVLSELSLFEVWFAWSHLVQIIKVALRHWISIIELKALLFPTVCTCIPRCWCDKRNIWQTLIGFCIITRKKQFANKAHYLMLYFTFFSTAKCLFHKFWLKYFRFWMVYGTTIWYRLFRMWQVFAKKRRKTFLDFHTKILWQRRNANYCTGTSLCTSTCLFSKKWW